MHHNRFFSSAVSPAGVPLAACALLLAALAPAAYPCHVPKDLRSHDPVGDDDPKLALMAHGGPREMITYTLEGATGCAGGQADIFDCSGLDLLAVVQLPAIGGGTGNDLWGWVDPVTNVEYALMGRSNGVAVLDLSDPTAPVYAANLPTQTGSSTWRDVKVLGQYAYVVADFNGAHGMQVFDLSALRGLTTTPATLAPVTVYDGLNRAHNLMINEDSDTAYAVGSETCAGGLHMIDLSTPTSPSFLGCFDADGYTHDAQCVIYAGPAAAYQGRELCFAANEDTLTVVDVTDKSNPVQLSRTTYEGSAYAHQGWLTEDHRLFIQDDEIDEFNFGHNTRTYVWDVSDPANASMLNHFDADGPSVDHNQYVLGRYTYQANYRRGLRVLEIVDAATGTLEEAAFFDTYPEADGNGFDGAWSTYPFLPSGLVLVSDINRGLFILRPTFRTPDGFVFGDGFESGSTSSWAETIAP
ncbi:MAG: choice-of-anchor B family protein [Acidobacteriota bacterium]